MSEDQAPRFKRNRFEKDYGIRVITYRPSAGHPEVAEFVQDLSARVREHEVQTQAQRETRPATPIERFTQEVVEWLSAIGYDVSREAPIDDQPNCLTAVLEQGSVSQRVRVHCIGGEIRASHVEALEASLDRHTNQGWAICDQRVSPRAAARANEIDGVETYRLADFLRDKVWGPYISALESLVLESKIPDRYVDPACRKQDMDAKGHGKPTEDMGGLDAYMDGWLTERGKVHISLLGEFGTGKTWFCRHYAWRRLHRYLADPVSERLPLLVTLREFVKTTSPEQLINDLLLERYRLPFVGSAFDVFQEMNRRGKLLLILDGFDEMARKADYQTVVDNFWELAKLAEDESKVVLTSRTEYFRWAKESEKILSGQEYGRKTIDLKPPRFEVLYLTPFDDERIRTMIVRRLGEADGTPIADKVLSHEHLKEMARKPVLTELLLAAIDEAGVDALNNEADIYLKATNRLLVRNIDTQRTFTSTADKLYFLCELAWEMIRDGELRIHYKEIPERIRDYFGERVADAQDLDHWDYDLRNQTLLHRNAAGDYEFAHKSLAEFFVALKFAAELGGLASEVLSTYREAGDRPCATLERPADLDQLVQTFGRFQSNDERMQAIWGFLPWLLDRDKVRYRLADLVLSCRHRTASDCALVAGNGLTLLQKLGFSTSSDGQTFRAADLSHLPLAHAKFSFFYSTDLTCADLRGSDLSFAAIDLPILRDADLRNAACQGLQLGGRGTWMRRQALGLQKILGATRVVLDVTGGIAVLALEWLADGALLVGAADGTVRQWRDGAGDEAILYPCTKSGIDDLRCHRQNPSALVLVGDHGVFAWDEASGLRKLEVPAPAFPGFLSALAPDGRHLLIWKEEGTLGLYDLRADGALVQTTAGLDRIGAVDLILSKEASVYAAGTLDGRLLVWQGLVDAPTTQVLGAGLPISAIHISRTASLLFAAALEEDSNRYFLNLWGWNIAAGTQLWQVRHEVFNPRSWRDNINERVTLGHHVDTDLLVVATGDSESPVRLLNAATGESIPGFPKCPSVQALAFNPNAAELALGHDNGSVSIWDCEPSSASFCACLRILDVRLDAHGARISGATGLDETVTWFRQWKSVQGTRLEFLADCGAELDEDQKRQLAEIHAERRSTEPGETGA